MACCLLACSGPPGAGLLRGEDPAPFAIVATQQSNSCGPGALGAEQLLEFTVELSTLPGQIFWDGRAAAPLVDEQFAFQIDVALPIAQASTADESCRVIRSDTITGQAQQPQGVLLSVAGLVGYRFRVAQADHCAPDVARQAGLERLPCEMSYAMEGRRSDD